MAERVLVATKLAKRGPPAVNAVASYVHACHVESTLALSDNAWLSGTLPASLRGWRGGVAQLELHPCGEVCAKISVGRHLPSLD